MSIDSCIFPNRLKEAQVTLLFKKNDPFLKSNYRPVSILPIHSTIFDKVLSVQLSDFLIIFLTIFHVRLERDMALLRLLED
jgi:hypothetical protein